MITFGRTPQIHIKAASANNTAAKKEIKLLMPPTPRKDFYPNGDLQFERELKNGEVTKEAYYNPSKKPGESIDSRLNNYYFFDPNSQKTISRKKTDNGEFFTEIRDGNENTTEIVEKNDYKRKTYTTENGDKIQEDSNYYPNGQMQCIITKQNGCTVSSQDMSPNGNIIREWFFNPKNNTIEEG